MTALAGLWRFDGRPDAAEGCARMLAAQELYGLHASAQWSDGGLAIGRRLMRILPEDRFDHQPLIGGAGRFVLVADVRLDNRDELARLLQIPAAQARNQCDAAILLAAIERWEEKCFDHLVGDYAFALWDGARRRLVLARDPLGQRPLHYHRADKFFAFASMPKGLHALPEIPYAADEERVAESLVIPWEYTARTYFCAIERVKSGHVCVLSESGIVSWRHWQPTRRRIELPRPEDYSEALRELLDQAVRCRLRGAEDVGAHLSGGLDSSAVAATAARLQATLGRRVIAFTAVPREGYYGPAGQIVDEGSRAATTAALYPNMEHVLIRAESRSLLDDLDRNIFLFDEPVSSVCNAQWWHGICDAARERKLKVMLTGQEGNTGLSYNGLELLPELLRSGRLLRLGHEVRALMAEAKWSWRTAVAWTFGPWFPAALWIWLNKVRTGTVFDSNVYAAINPRRLAQLDIAARAKQCGVDLAWRPWKDGFAMRLWTLYNCDSGNGNKGVLGGWQVDQRDPTADVRLLEFCLAVPTEQFLSNGLRKVLARRALADRVPKMVIEETRRGVQAADWHERLTAARDQVASELDRLDTCPSAADAIDLPRLHKLVKNWPTGGWESDEVYASYRAALLRAISAGYFLRRAAGGNL